MQISIYKTYSFL